MDNDPFLPEPAPTPFSREPESQPQPVRRRRWRGALAAAVAGGVLGAAIATPVVWGLRDDSGTSSSSTSAAAGSGTTTVEPAVDPRDQTSPYTQTLPYQPSQPGFGSDSTTATATATDATDAQSAGVVLIDTVLNGGTGAGTGLVLSSSGLVLTNYHVVEDSTDVAVTIATTGETYDATVVGFDEASDVALVQLADASDLTTVDLDDDGGAALDEAVTAIGNAEGQGYLSASAGTVEALDQSITTSNSDGSDDEDLSGLIETDAALVGGYSGGALLDAEGEVVGINTAASSGGVAQSYAVPIEEALAIADQIESGTETTAVQVGPSAYLGIAVATTTGLQVAEVEADTPAESAGLVAGDTVTSVDGTPVTTLDDLGTALATFEPGDRVALGWLDTSGTAQTASVTLGESPVN